MTPSSSAVSGGGFSAPSIHSSSKLAARAVRTLSAQAGVAIENRNIPSFLALLRQKVAGNVEGTLADAVGKGGYDVSDNSEKELPEIILIGTLSVLCLCEATANVLRREESMSKRVSVEAGSPLGWEYVGDEGIVIGIDDFGSSGPYLEVFNKYGFTEENVTKTAKSLLTK
ncbi:hypothetical protein CQW23_31362 [Capsicum baccatum]|uniref:Transketolase-like C-terminal domain-containing protein n=1 Tax=Capsicum baccatum TaxID=33114 RepID=A0A2G2V7S2_CAPBA|nr:hypothetical protein CQW23_31362 [Capsicum baccatum]